MEILITATALATILVLLVIVGTGGKPMVFVTSFGEAVSTLVKNKGALLWTGLLIFLVVGFL